MWNAASNVLGLGLNLATAKWQDKRQLEQQKKLQALQVAGQKELGAYNHGLAMDMFHKGNEWNSAAEQRKRLEEAGLNVGLMYGGSGGGGATASSQSAGSSGGAAGAAAAGTQMGMAMQLAQIENLRAQTKKTTAEAENVPKTGAEIESRTSLNWAEVDNKKLQYFGLQFENRLKEVEANVSEATEQWQVDNVIQSYLKLEAETQEAIRNSLVSKETATEEIRQSQLRTVEMMVDVRAKEKKIQVDDQSIKLMSEQMMKIRNDVQVDLRNVSVKEGELLIKKAMQVIAQENTNNAIIQTEFNTSDAMKVKQWFDLVLEPLRVLSGFMPFGGSAGATPTQTGYMLKVN